MGLQQQRHRAGKTFGQRLAHAGRVVGGFLDKGAHVAHRVASAVDPGLVDAVAGREYGDVLRHTRTALGGYEAARAAATGRGR